MLTLPSSVRIFIYTQLAVMRCGFNKLSIFADHMMGQDLFSRCRSERRHYQDYKSCLTAQFEVTVNFWRGRVARNLTPLEQDKIFKRCFNKNRWVKVRQKVGLENFKFHDLRKTLGSVLAQNGVSTVVIQRLLEHSSPDLTKQVYTNVDPILRQVVDQIPAGDWL